MWGGWSIIVTIKLDTLGGTFRAIVALKYDFYVVEYDKILVTTKKTMSTEGGGVENHNVCY